MSRATFFLFFLTTAVSLLEIPFPGLSDTLALSPHRVQSAPWMFVSSIFVHVNLGHLAQNMVALLIFGTFLEKVIKPKKLLIMYFASGIAGNIAAFFFYPDALSLGASGAIMGLVGCLTVLRPKASVWFGAELPVLFFSALWVFTDLVGLFVPSDVGNAAHLGGFIMGIAFGRVWKKNFREEIEIRKRVRKALK
ncbi:Rhomboid protease GlpG [uncultured archaeon]|nr:Rhomboid protease GlpG [uncultured archaeon]